MKLFETVQRNFASVGYSLLYSNQKYHLNARNMTVIFLLTINTLANGAYILYNTESFEEYLQDIYVTSTVAMVLVILMIFIALMSNVFKLIENLEQIVEKSMIKVF